MVGFDRAPHGHPGGGSTDLAEWFDFCRHHGVPPLVATLDHADAYGCCLGEAPRPR